MTIRQSLVLLASLCALLASAPAQNAQAAPQKSISTGRPSKLEQSQNQPQATQSSKDDPRAWNYNVKAFARALGNHGGWWSFLTEAEKSAFLDGYQRAMRLSLTTNEIPCEILKKQLSPSPDAQAFNNQLVMVSAICKQSDEFSGFEKVTVKDLDEFYSDPVNQPILLEFSMPYLRDKATGRKTEGQLLDALRAQQRDIHDCSKYPNLCKLGMSESTLR